MARKFMGVSTQYKLIATLFNKNADDLSEMWEADAKDFILNHQEALARILRMTQHLLRFRLDSGIIINSLTWIARGCHGEPSG